MDRVIRQLDPPSLVPMAHAAAQFMEEVTVASVGRESGHPYSSRDDMKKKGLVQLPGAPYLTVTFDSK